MVVQYKICRKCGIDKAFDKFAKNKTKKDGIGSWCLECCRVEAAKRYAEYPDRIKATNRKSDKKNWGRKYEGIKKWAKDNPERWRELQRKSYKKHAEARKRQTNEYRQANPVPSDIVRDRKRRWMQTNKHRHAAIQRGRDAMKLRATPIWSDKSLIVGIYAEAARRTAETGVDHQVDHIVPLKSKIVCGLHVPWNLQLLTKSENSRKNNKLLENVVCA